MSKKLTCENGFFTTGNAAAWFLSVLYGFEASDFYQSHWNTSGKEHDQISSIII